MHGVGLRTFEHTAVGKINGDPARPKAVVADRRHDARGQGGAKIAAHLCHFSEPTAVGTIEI